MKKSDFAKASLSIMSVPALVASVAGVVLSVSSDQVSAQTIGCTAGTPTLAVTCSGTGGNASGFIARDLALTGSVGVVIQVAEDTTGFGACGGHVQGSGNRFGLTTLGGSIETVTGTPGSVPTAANISGGGC